MATEVNKWYHNIELEPTQITPGFGFQNIAATRKVMAGLDEILGLHLDRVEVVEDLPQVPLGPQDLGIGRRSGLRRRVRVLGARGLDLPILAHDETRLVMNAWPDTFKGGARPIGAEADRLAAKIAHLRIFEDEAGKMNRSVLDVGGEALVVSQFTLYADTRKGRRPSFTDAALPEIARPLVERFAAILRELGVPAQSGEFGAHMLVEIDNDGPVTIQLER